MIGWECWGTAFHNSKFLCDSVKYIFKLAYFWYQESCQIASSDCIVTGGTLGYKWQVCDFPDILSRPSDRSYKRGPGLKNLKAISHVHRCASPLWLNGKCKNKFVLSPDGQLCITLTKRTWSYSAQSVLSNHILLSSKNRMSVTCVLLHFPISYI